MNLFKRKSSKKIEERAFFPASKQVFGTLLFSGEKNPTVQSCVSKIANTLGILPINLYAHTKSGKKLAVDHELFRVLERPNFEETPTLFYTTMIRQLLLKGNAYIYIGRSNSRIVNLQLIDPNNVEVKRNESGYKYFKIAGKTYTEKDILHIPFNGPGYNGTVGVSPIKIQQELIQLDNNLLQYINMYFNNSLGTRYAIELGPEYARKDNELDKLYASIIPVLNKYVVGVENSGKPLIPPPNSKLTKIEQTSNVQSQLDSLLTMIERQIAQAFNVPYEILDSTGQKYGSLEDKQQDFLQNCIQPIGDHIAQSFERVIDPIDPKLFVAWDYSHMLKTDFKSTVEYLSKEVQSGLLTPNEARSKIGMETIGPAGDTYWLPANLIPMTEDNINAILAVSKAKMAEINKKENHSPLGDDKE